ncbi:MAG: UDP-N-acetylmuramoyl-L-alanine--D-glutamate ligase [Traorella sp.]
MKVLVVGAAKSGIAVAKLLNQNGYEVILTDQKEVVEKKELEEVGIRVVDKGHPDWLKNKDYAFIVKNPGIKYSVDIIDYFVKNKIKIYTEIEIAYRLTPHFHYGAVTGTNGKTTITSMLHACLKKNHQSIAAGNIGTPLSEWALNCGNEEKDVALELSNFQLLGIETFRPTVSVVCNLAPDHLDYMPSVESYYASKMNIMMNQKDDDWFLRNVDDELVMEYSKEVKCKVIDFSLKRKDVDIYLDHGEAFFQGNHLFYVKDLKVVGLHNVSNAMIAAVMALKMGVSYEDIESALTSFKGIEHRIEYIGEKDGIKFYNDSKATNTQAACIALASFEKNILLLAGGKDKGISFDEMHDYDDRVKHCFAFGQTKEKIASEFTNSSLCETMHDALIEAMKIAQSGDVILLSPACSSYDQFKNYEVRGDLFREDCLNIIG